VVSPVAWVSGECDPADRVALAERLARRIVALRARPRVLVARPAGQAAELVASLEAAGVEPVHVPAIEIRPAVPGGALDAAIARARAGDTVVMTSANAARATLDAAARTGAQPALLDWAAVGEATARVILDAGVRPVFVPTEPTGAALARELPLRPGGRALLPHADIADRALADGLRARGAQVTEVVAYETLEAPGSSSGLLTAALADGPVDALVLTSGSTARGLLALAADDRSRARLLATPVLAAGETTAAAAREAGYATVLVAPGPAAPDLAAFTAVSLGVTQRAGAEPLAEPLADPLATGAAR
jgi:uroporphyrinogen-III synthase